MPLRTRYPASPRRPGFQGRRGFTLIEASLATIIVGVGVLATMQLFTAITQQTQTNNRMTTAMLLASHVQEAMAGLNFNDPQDGPATFGPEDNETLASFDDVDDFDGQSWSPPRNALLAAVPAVDRYTQSVEVHPLRPHELEGNADGSMDAVYHAEPDYCVRVVVTITYRPTPTAAPQELYRQAWIRVNG